MVLLTVVFLESWDGEERLGERPETRDRRRWEEASMSVGKGEAARVVGARLAAEVGCRKLNAGLDAAAGGIWFAGRRLSEVRDGHRTEILRRGRSLVCRAGICTLSNQTNTLLGRK